MASRHATTEPPGLSLYNVYLTLELKSAPLCTKRELDGGARENIAAEIHVSVLQEVCQRDAISDKAKSAMSKK